MARTPKLEDLEASASDAPPLAIPPGADITAKFKAGVDTSELSGERARSYAQELQELAAEEYPDVPTDPLSEFCEEWKNFIGYPLKIVRLPDPATRRIPGSTYNRPCFELEQLSDMPFDPVNLVGALQIVNGNSGGVFRFWLTDEIGQAVPGARLDRIVIADPPRQYNSNASMNATHDPRYDSRYYQQPPTPQPTKVEPSALELRMQDLQEKLLSNALARLLEPQSPPQPAPGAGLTDEDRLTLLLVKEGGLLPTVVGRLAALAGAPENATAKETWLERGMNAAVHIAETNPAIVERISGTIEQVVKRILPAPPNRQPQQPWIQPPPPRELRPAQTPTPSAAHPTGLPEAPEPEEDEEDADIMAILEDLFTLLTSNDPLVAEHPTFTQLAQDYPAKFRIAIAMLAAQPMPTIIEWLKEKSPLYEAMLNSPQMGPHYHKRLLELQVLCRTPAPQSAPDIELTQ